MMLDALTFLIVGLAAFSILRRYTRPKSARLACVDNADNGTCGSCNRCGFDLKEK